MAITPELFDEYDCLRSSIDKCLPRGDYRFSAHSDDIWRTGLRRRGTVGWLCSSDTLLGHFRSDPEDPEAIRLAHLGADEEVELMDGDDVSRRNCRS